MARVFLFFRSRLQKKQFHLYKSSMASCVTLREGVERVAQSGRNGREMFMRREVSEEGQKKESPFVEGVEGLKVPFSRSSRKDLFRDVMKFRYLIFLESADGLADDVVQNTAVGVVSGLGVGIEAQDGLERADLSARDVYGDLLAGLDLGDVSQVEGEGFLSSESQYVSILAFLVLQRDNTELYEVGAVDALVGDGNDGLYAEQRGSLGGPIARGARAVELSSEDDEWGASLDVALRGVVDGELLASGLMDGDRALFADQLVQQADVGEGTAGHDLVVTTARTVRVEVLALDSALSEEARSGGILGDVSGGRNVIGSDEISEIEQARGALDLSHGSVRLGHALEVRGRVNVGGGSVPRVHGLAGGLERGPRGGSLRDARVHLLELLCDYRLGYNGLNLVVRGPDVLQEDILASSVLSDWILGPINVHLSSERISNDKGWRCEVVSLHVRMNASLEVTVS